MTERQSTERGVQRCWASVAAVGPPAGERESGAGQGKGRAGCGRCRPRNRDGGMGRKGKGAGLQAKLRREGFFLFLFQSLFQIHFQKLFELV